LAAGLEDTDMVGIRVRDARGGASRGRLCVRLLELKEDHIVLALTDVAGLPVACEVDVLVVGGGPAGVGAAFAAARMGAETLVVEQFNCLGGVATAGGHGHISKFDEDGTVHLSKGHPMFQHRVPHTAWLHRQLAPARHPMLQHWVPHISQLR